MLANNTSYSLSYEMDKFTKAIEKTVSIIRELQCESKTFPLPPGHLSLSDICPPDICPSPDICPPNIWQGTTFAPLPK